ncbi:hypothetical protein MTR67_041794, partial [Solanum verrucosum]
LFSFFFFFLTVVSGCRFANPTSCTHRVPLFQGGCTKISRNTNLPPGPLDLPIIGNLHQYDSVTPHIYFWKLSKKYGKIFLLKFGSTPVVVIFSAKLAKEVMKTQDLAFCSRPSTLCQQKLSYNSHDIVFSPMTIGEKLENFAYFIYLVSRKYNLSCMTEY